MEEALGGGEALATDAIARFHRLDGYDVYFLTGSGSRRPDAPADSGRR